MIVGYKNDNFLSLFILAIFCGFIIAMIVKADNYKQRVLYVATGALFNPTTVFQKSNILSIANAISLESVE